MAVNGGRMATHAEIALLAQEPWISMEVAPRLAHRKPSTLRSWVRAGKVRAYETKRRTWLCRDDLLYCVRAAHGRQSMMTLVERGTAPLDAEGLNGYEIVRWAQKMQYRKLLLPLPVDPDLPPAEREDFVAIHEKIAQLEATVRALAGQFHMPARMQSIDEEGVHEILLRVHHALQKRTWTNKEVKAYLRMLAQLGHTHYDAIDEWAITHPEVAQDLCGKNLPPHTPLLRLAYRLKKHTTHRATKSPVLQELSAQSVTVLKHVEERCRERAILWALRLGTMAPIGTCPTDQWILERLL